MRKFYMTSCVAIGLALFAGQSAAQQLTQQTIAGPSDNADFSLQVRGSDNLLYFCRPDITVVNGRQTRFCRPATAFGPNGGLVTGGLSAATTGGVVAGLMALVAISASSDTK